jgi:outer membrane immunogenic protein
MEIPMRLSTSATATAIALGFWIGSNTLESAFAAPAVGQRLLHLPASAVPFDRTYVPLQLQPHLRKPPAFFKKVTKPRRLKKRKRIGRKTAFHASRNYYPIPLPPRVVRPVEQAIAISQSNSSSLPNRFFDGAYAGLAIGREQTTIGDTSHDGTLSPFQGYAEPTNNRIITFWSFAGINKQFKSMLAGIEGDIGTRFPTAEHSHAPYGALRASGLTASFRGRLGTIVDGLLLYGTGGLAAGNFSKVFNGLNYDAFHGGWTAGVGIEGFVTPALLLRAEYFYSRFPAVQFESHTLRAGFAIKF